MKNYWLDKEKAYKRYLEITAAKPLVTDDDWRRMCAEGRELNAIEATYHFGYKAIQGANKGRSK